MLCTEYAWDCSVVLSFSTTKVNLFGRTLRHTFFACGTLNDEEKGVITHIIIIIRYRLQTFEVWFARQTGINTSLEAKNENGFKEKEEWKRTPCASKLSLLYHILIEKCVRIDGKHNKTQTLLNSQWERKLCVFSKRLISRDALLWVELLRWMYLFAKLKTNHCKWLLDTSVYCDSECSAAVEFLCGALRIHCVIYCIS